MTPVGKPPHGSIPEKISPGLLNKRRHRSMQQVLAILLLALGIASICLGLYSLIQAFDFLDLPTMSKVWLARAVVKMGVGWATLHIGSKYIETF